MRKPQMTLTHWLILAMLSLLILVPMLACNDGGGDGPVITSPTTKFIRDDESEHLADVSVEGTREPAVEAAESGLDGEQAP